MEDEPRQERRQDYPSEPVCPLGHVHLATDPLDWRWEQSAVKRDEEPLSKRPKVRKLHSLDGYEERSYDVERKTGDCPRERWHRSPEILRSRPEARVRVNAASEDAPGADARRALV